MSTEEFKHLQEQLKNLESQLKVYENHFYIMQNEIQYNQKTIQLEQTKQQSQITGLASLILDYVKESRQYEEQREANLLQRINNVVNLDLNDFGNLSAALTGGTSVGSNSLNSDASLMNGINLTTSAGQTPSQSSTSMLSSSRATEQLFSSSGLSQNHQLQQYPQANSLAALQQSFILQQQQQQQQQVHQQQQQQVQQQAQQQRNQSRIHQQQSLKSQKQQQQRIQQQRLSDRRTPIQPRKKRKPQPPPQLLSTNTDPASILDNHLSSFGRTPQTSTKTAQGSIAPSESVRSLQMDGTIAHEDGKTRKIYDKSYNFIKAPNTVEEVWNEYAIGLNNQPAIKSLELEFKTGWRKDPATSKKFNRRKAIYHAIEKGLDKGYSLEYSIQLLEEFRWIDREKNLKQPIGWLCHGNVPTELK